MSEHTPTPWYESDEAFGPGIMAKPDGETEVLVVSGFDDGYPQDPPIRARIVACANAFHDPAGRKIATEDIGEATFWKLYDRLVDMTHSEFALSGVVSDASKRAVGFLKSLKIQEPEDG